jgi:hypothetical protein
MEHEYEVYQPHKEVGLVEETTDFRHFNDEESEAYQRWHITNNR